MLRIWLNEDRIDDPKKMITNADIEYWLGIIGSEEFKKKQKQEKSFWRNAVKEIKKGLINKFK